MSYDKSQKLNYVSALDNNTDKIIEFLDTWPEMYAEYNRAGLSAGLVDDDLDGSIYAGTSAADIKTGISACNSVYNYLAGHADLAAWRGQMETLAKRR